MWANHSNLTKAVFLIAGVLTCRKISLTYPSGGSLVLLREPSTQLSGNPRNFEHLSHDEAIRPLGHVSGNLTLAKLPDQAHSF